MFPEKISQDGKNVFSGEREIGTNINDFSADHINRYRFAAYFILPGDVVLDAACGVGYGTALLAEKAAEVHGIDYNTEALAYAGEHWQRANISHHQGDLLEEVTYPAGKTFDKIVSFETIEHLKDDRLFLRHLASRLKPGGVLFVSAPNADVIDVRDNPWHERHYTPSEFFNLLADQFSFVSEFTQIDNGIRKGRGGDNNVLVCGNNYSIQRRLPLYRLHKALYRLKRRLLSACGC